MARLSSALRLMRRRPGAADALLAVALVALAEVETLTNDASPGPRGALAAAGLIAMLSLAWRRRARWLRRP